MRCLLFVGVFVFLCVTACGEATSTQSQATQSGQGVADGKKYDLQLSGMMWGSAWPDIIKDVLKHQVGVAIVEDVKYPEQTTTVVMKQGYQFDVEAANQALREASPSNPFVIESIGEGIE